MRRNILQTFRGWRVALNIVLFGCVLLLWIDSYSHARRLLLPIPLGEAPYGFLSRAGSLHFIEYDFWEHESRRDFVQFSLPFWTLAIVPLTAVALTAVMRRKTGEQPTLTKMETGQTTPPLHFQ